MSLSRLFRPNNDRSILRNLVADREGWEKIVQKPLAEEKKTKLVSLNQQIDSFASKWAFKGLGALWNPQFINDFLKLKANESTQKTGQKVFVTVWLHRLLLSLRVAKYCPAIGYNGGDMTIMGKAVDAIQAKIVVNNDLRNLEVIEDSFHLPDDIRSYSENEEIEEKEDSNLEALLEDLVVTEELGMNRLVALDSSSKANRSLERQDAIDLNWWGEKIEEEIEEKVEPKIEDESEDKKESFDIRSVLCGYRHEVDSDVKVETDVKPKVTIIGFHPPSSVPMDRPNQQIINLPKPDRLCNLGKTIAEYCAKCLSTSMLDSYIDKIELSEVTEVADENDEFSEDLDPKYLKFLSESFSSDADDKVPTVMSVVTIDTAEQSIPQAPKMNRSRENQDDLDFTLPTDMFNTSANDGPATPRSIIREAIEERRIIQDASEAAWAESTPQGKELRKFRGRKFPPL